MIKNEVEHTDGEFLISILSPLWLRPVQQTLNLWVQSPCVAPFPGRVDRIGAHSRSSRRPGLDDRQVFDGFLAPELQAIITCMDAIDRGLDSAA
jgi:hypothetical protein